MLAPGVRVGPGRPSFTMDRCPSFKINGGQMRPIIRYLAWGTLATAAVAAVASAQDSTDADRRQAAIVLDHTFTGPVGEPIRVFLAKDVTYHAETSGNGIQLQLRPLLGSTPPPLLEPLLAGQSAGSESIYIVKPRADAVYEFVSAGGDATRPVNLRVYAVKEKGKKP
jgi:hypothetical protein